MLSLSVPDLLIGLLDLIEIAEMQILDWSLEKLNLGVAFPNLSPQPQQQLDTIFAESLSHLGRPSQLSVQGSFAGFLGLSTNAQCWCLDLFSLSTVDWKALLQ